MTVKATGRMEINEEDVDGVSEQGPDGMRTHPIPRKTCDNPEDNTVRYK